MLLKTSVAHAVAPDRLEIELLTDTILAQIANTAIMHEYIKRKFNAKHTILPVLFETIEHFNSLKHLLSIGDLQDFDVLPLFDYEFARQWIIDHGDNFTPRRVFGIKNVVLCEGTDDLIFEQPELPRRCVICHGGDAKKCSGCRCVWYCSTECQSADWSEHRLICHKNKEYLESILGELPNQVEEDEEDEEDEDEDED